MRAAVELVTHALALELLAGAILCAVAPWIVDGKAGPMVRRACVLLVWSGFLTVALGAALWAF